MLQGDRTKNVGVVDAEYIVHMGLPTLGFSEGNKASNFFIRGTGTLSLAELE